MEESKSLHIAVISTSEPAAQALKERLLSGLHGYPTVDSHQVETAEELTTRLADESPDVFFLVMTEAGNNIFRSLTTSIGTTCFKPLIAVADDKSRHLGIRAIRMGASDFVRASRLIAHSLAQTITFAVQNHKNRLTIEHRLAFEKLVSHISTNFINLPTSQIDQGLTHALQLIGKHAQVDRSYILLMSPDRRTFNMTHEWHAEGIESAKEFYREMPVDQFQLLFDDSGEEQIIFFSRTQEMLERAQPLKDLLQQRGVRSLLAVPMVSHGQTIGFVGFASLSREQQWPKDIVSLLELVGQVFVNVLQRKETQIALFESEKRFETLIENLGEGILYCDRSDNVIHVNNRFCQLTGYRLDEVVGNSAIDLFLLGNDSEELRAKTRRRLQGISESYEIQFRKKDGQVFWAEIAATPIRNLDGEIIGTLGAVTDITERKSVLSRLQESEQKYRDLVQTSQDLIWSLDQEGRWIFVNEACRRILGYEPEELLGKKFTEFQPDYQAKADLQIFQKILDGTPCFDYETDYLRKDGETVILSFNAVVVRDQDGTVLGTAGTASDITSRIRSQRALAEQKKFFRQIIDTNPSLMYAKDREGRYTLVNRSFATLYGRTVEEIEGKTLGEFSNGIGDPEYFRAQDREVLESRKLHTYEERLDFPDTNESIWFHTIKRPLYSKGDTPSHVLGVSVDLNQRKRSEEALKHVVEGTAAATAENFFHSLVRHLAVSLGAHFAFIAVFTDKTRTRMKTLAQCIDGVEREEMEFDLPGTISERVLEEGFFEVQAGAREIFPDSQLLQADAIESFMGTVIRDTQGNPNGVLAVLNQKPLEEWPMARYILTIFAARAGAEFERIQTESETMLLQRQFNQAQKLEAIGQLAAGIAHDLNNALGAVMGHLQLIKMTASLSGDHNESLEIALNGCERASGLIGQLLGFSRQGKYNPGPLCVQKAVGEAVQFLDHVVGKQIRIEVTGEDEDLFVNADPNQVQQALTNLIINAKHAMPEGGVIVIDFATQHMSLTQQFNPKARDGTYVVIRVADTGKGIPPDAIDKIFEPFFTTKNDQKGTGLGLSMVYGMMQNHSGWITVDSTVGRGTVFSLFFPILESSETLPADSVTVAGDGSMPLVLVVDDEPFLVELCVNFLERSGFAAEGFTDAREALNWYQQRASDVDLMVLDMKMPHIDGEEFFDRARAINPQAKAVVLSGFIQDESAQRLIRKGALKFFHKPLKYPELIAWIRQALEPEQLRVKETA